LKKQHAERVRVIHYLVFGFSLVLLFACLTISVQASSPITSSGLNTQVGQPITLPSGQTQYDITGGTRPGGGTNLFHSFGDFNVPNNNIANFLNDSGLATSNILGRVTGGNISSIYGTIQTTGFLNANLFLMNPAGFLFGPNATINVGGMMAFTSADYLRLADGALFNGIPNAAADALLSAAPVAAFGFLGSNPGAITVQGSQLSVTPGQSISLVGGNITIQSGLLDDGITIQPARLSAPGGQINLASVASPGEVLLSNLQYAPNVNGQSFTTMGNINLSQGALLDVSADAAGTVRIRGGQLVIDNATISADTVNSNGAPVAIDINVTGDISLTTVDNPVLTARTTGSGNAGAVQITSTNMDVTADALNNFIVPVIDTHTEGSGKAGDVSITAANNLTATDVGLALALFIDSGTEGPGHGGNVTVTAKNFDMTQISINTGVFIPTLFGEEVAGSGGNLTITADSFHVGTGLFGISSSLVTDASASGGQGGQLTITAHDIQLSNGLLSASGGSKAGAIRINTDQLIADSSQFEVDNGIGSSGGITITGKVVELTNGTTVASQTFGDQAGGNLTITATDHLTLADDPAISQFTSRPTGLFTNSLGGAGNFGAAGAITVTTPNLQILGGARIDSSSRTSGNAGPITITADSISISGEGPQRLFPDFAFNLAGLSSGIYARTIGSQFCTGPCGNAALISITTGSLSLTQGAQIDSSTSSTGRGGDITITANQISIAGTRTDGTPAGIFSRTIGATPDARAGGNIALTAGQSVIISNGASVSASSTGPGATGNITINAGNQLTMTNASVTTEADQSSGGAIKITTNPNGTVQLTDSMISASVLNGEGGGGSVNIDPQSVILQNSQILANAVFGPGGNIFITTNLLLQDANSVISASSRFGQNGTITIQSPINPAGGKIIPLSQKPLIATALLSQRCAALAGGGYSSFTVAGRDSLPAEPGSWLASPLAMTTVEFSSSSVTNTGTMTSMHEPEKEAPLLSLRQIAPPGFLTHTFAADSYAGCTS
jgi:filamentous hemagglutinin family protein